MSPLTIILVAASVMLAVGLGGVLVWLGYTTYLNRLERRLAARKGIYRALVDQLASRERGLLEPELRRLDTLYDLEALEALLEEQARGTDERPRWLLDAYDRLGLVDRYVERLRHARAWRQRAFAAELLGRVGSAKAVPALLETVQAARTEDADVREIALRALARIADPRAVAPLVEALRSAEPWLAPRLADILARHGELAVEPLLAVLDEPGHQLARSWAANVLGELGAQSAFPALVRSLGDLDDEVRAKAATALGRLGDRRAVSYLLESLLGDPAPFVRARIAAALGRFGQPEVIDHLVRALGDQAWWVRMRSVEALEQIGSAAEGPLLMALDDADPEIRVRAASALERLGVPASLVGMIQRGERMAEAMETLVKFAMAGARELLAELLVHPAPEVRTAVVTAVRRGARRDLGPALVRLARTDADPAIRSMGFDTLRALRVPEAVPAAVEGMVDPDERVRAAAVALVGDIGGPETVGQLRTRTADPERVVRAAAVRALGLMKTPAAAPDFQRLLEDPDSEVRHAAAGAAGEAGARQLVPALAAALGDSHAEVRVAAARSLGMLGERRAVPDLLRAYAGAEPDLREAVIEAISRLDPTTAVGLVDQLIESGDSAGKIGAIRTLGRLHSPAVNPVLERLRQDPDPAVRRAVIQVSGGGAVAGAAVIASHGLQDPDEQVRAAAADACSRLRLEAQGHVLLDLLRADPSPLVRERAALAVGLLQVPGGEEALLAACQAPEPLGVRAAAALATGAFAQDSIVARVAEMTDEAALREHLRARLTEDPEFRLLGRRLSQARQVELRALGALTEEEVQASMAQGMRTVLDAGERIRLVSSLRALRGERSKETLLQVARRDPSPEVRTAALTAAGELVHQEELLDVVRRALDDPSLLVRRAAVAVCGRLAPERSLVFLLRTLRPDEDPAVLAAVAEVAETGFATFHDIALALPADGAEAVLIARTARHLHHPGLRELLPALVGSGSPEVREAIAAVWHHRPDLVDRDALERLVLDPVPAVRREAARVAVAAGQGGLIERLAEDPDPTVRRALALSLATAPELGDRALRPLIRLSGDGEMSVRAAAYVGRLLLGTPVTLPPLLDPASAAEALRATADMGALRETARTAAAEDHRLAAALALALLQDEVAREVARTDPVPTVRHRVSGALELVASRQEGEAR